MKLMNPHSVERTLHERGVNVPAYLAAQMLSQTRPAGGALIDDGLFRAQDNIALGGVLFIAGVDHQPTHFDQALPVIFMEVS